MLGKTEGRRRRGRQRLRWLDSITIYLLSSIHDSVIMNLSKLQEMVEGQRSLACCSPQGRKESAMTERLTLFHWSIMVAEVEAWGSLADSGPLSVVCFVLTVTFLSRKL